MTWSIARKMERRWGNIRMMFVSIFGAVSGIVAASLIMPRLPVIVGAQYFYCSILGAYLFHCTCVSLTLLDFSLSLNEDKWFVIRCIVMLMLGIFPHVGIIPSALSMVFGFISASIALAPPLYNNPHRKQCDRSASCNFVEFRKCINLSWILTLTYIVLFFEQSGSRSIYGNIDTPRSTSHWNYVLVQENRYHKYM